MTIVLNTVLNLLLAFAALLSAQLAVAWGEIGSYPLVGDKSGMAGFGAIVILMPVRWLLLAVGLWVGVSRGAFPFLPGGKGLQSALVLGLHFGLGVVAYQVFEWITEGIHGGNSGPQRVAVIFGLILPVALLLVAGYGVNRGWLGRRPLVATGLAVLIVASQMAGWRQGYLRGGPDPDPAAQAQ